MMNQKPDTRVTPEIARELCQRTGSAAVLDGSIAQVGTPYLLTVKAVNCSNGETLTSTEAQASDKNHVLDALGNMASEMRSKLGESLVTIQDHSRPLEQATTSSLEALKAYNAGLKMAFSSGLQAGIPFLRRAVELDPQFAMAHAHMGLMYSASGESELAVKSLSKGFQLRDRVSDRERFFIDSSYHRAVTGNLEKAIETCELWAQTYARDERPHSLLSGFLYQGLGKYEASLEEAQQAIRADPDVTPSYINLAFSYFYLGRFKEAQVTAQRAFDRKLYMPELSLLQYQIAFLKGDRARMELERSGAQGKAGAEDWINHLEALVLAQSGQLLAARQMSELAVESARQAGNRERAATYEVGVAVWEALVGNGAAAGRAATAGLALSKSRDIEYGASFALAVSGDFSRSQALTKDLEEQFPDDTSVRFSYLPVLHGLFALHRNEPDAAIEQLRIAAPYELAQSRIGFFGFFGNLYPVYVRGLAYLSAHRETQAAAEFQKILDHRSIAISDPIGALARLQLGRAVGISGDKAKAKSAYEDFLALWKDADPDIPILKQAKAEYAKLQ
jgi:tetratricopeptide (TPR) repeat protein